MMCSDSILKPPGPPPIEPPPSAGGTSNTLNFNKTTSVSSTVMSSTIPTIGALLVVIELNITEDGAWAREPS